MTERVQIQKKQRFEIFKRDGFVCVYCGRHPPDVELHCDHVIPVKEGGQNDDANLVTSCADCNHGKGATSLNVVPETVSDKTEKLIELEEQARGFEKAVRAKKARLEYNAWIVLTSLLHQWGEDPTIEGVDSKWLRSVMRFLDKMDSDEVMFCMDIATTKDLPSKESTFLYFCKVCWNKLRVEQDG